MIIIINLCVGFPRLLLKSLSILDVVIVIKANGITMPIFKRAAVGFFNCFVLNYTYVESIFIDKRKIMRFF